MIPIHSLLRYSSPQASQSGIVIPSKLFDTNKRIPDAPLKIFQDQLVDQTPQKTFNYLKLQFLLTEGKGKAPGFPILDHLLNSLDRPIDFNSFAPKSLELYRRSGVQVPGTQTLLFIV